MTHLFAATGPRVFFFFLALTSILATAHADPISPTYTVTNLGSGAITITAANGSTVPVDYGATSGDLATLLPAAANGGQIVSVSNGQMAYPFTLTPTTPLNANTGIMTSFPLAQLPPINGNGTYGDPANAYSVLVGPALTNANGIVAAINSAGVNGHESTEVAEYSVRNPNGSWSSPVVIWSGSIQYSQSPNGVAITGINNANQIIGTASLGYAGEWNAFLYNVNTHTLTNLSTLPALTGYINILPIAIDDQGRILAEASPTPGFGYTEQTFLLTPAGVTSEPLAAPVPEPGSAAVMALVMAAFAVHRIHDRRSRRRLPARQDQGLS